MKSTTLPLVAGALITNKNEITLPENIIRDARKAMDMMQAVSKNAA